MRKRKCFLNLAKSILRWKDEKHKKKKLGNQKIVLILCEIENLELGPLCSSELNCGVPGFENCKALLVLEIVDLFGEADLENI